MARTHVPSKQGTAIPYCPAISKQLKRNAAIALKSINRFPVRELEDLLEEAIQNQQKSNPATERLPNDRS